MTACREKQRERERFKKAIPVEEQFTWLVRKRDRLVKME